MKVKIILLAVLVTLGLANFSVMAAPIVTYDSGFFSTVPHTLVTFETDGSGNPVILSEGASRDMPSNEYAHLGFTFNPAVKWVNDAGPSFDAAQAIGGSMDIAIPAFADDDYLVEFSVPVKSFGFWVVNNNNYPAPPTFEAYGAGGLIETAMFEGPAIDGTVGVADYGFLGILADENITRIHVVKDATIFDNFVFSEHGSRIIPAPGAILLCGMGVGLVGWLRKRKTL